MRHSATISACVVLIAALAAADASAQDRRGVVFGDVGWASIGHADSEQGKAPIFGGGAAFHLTPRLVVAGDVHRARVEQVFGREEHVFTVLTFTGSVLFRAPVEGRVHVLAGGGVAAQRAHTKFNEPPFPRADRTEILRLLHATAGADWDLSTRLVLRTHGVLWMGAGLDWVFGVRAGLGYRF